LSGLADISDRHEQSVVAAKVQSQMAMCAEDVLSRRDMESAGRTAALRLAIAANALSAEYDLKTPAVVYLALARSQYENQEYRRAIGTCLRWSSATHLQGSYETYLLLSAASGQIGQSEAAYDWWLASENYWFSNSIVGRERLASVLSDARRFVEEGNHDPATKLTVEQELRLYTRIVDAYPDVHEMRKYRGYCLFQLGLWQEAKSEFEILMKQGWSDVYSSGPLTLLSLFFQPDSFAPEVAKDMRDRALGVAEAYDGNVLVVALMLGDRDGRWADLAMLEHVRAWPGVGQGLVAFRGKHFDEAYGLLLTHHNPFPARNVLAEIVMALIDWERGEAEKAQAGLTRAEEAIEAMSPREGIPRTNDNVGFATSVIWLEPLLLLREAREKLPREPGAAPASIDKYLYPQATP
jgi:hypothetical protein